LRVEGQRRYNGATARLQAALDGTGVTLLSANTVLAVLDDWAQTFLAVTCIAQAVKMHRRHFACWRRRNDTVP
jgi:hypothetical protein